MGLLSDPPLCLKKLQRAPTRVLAVAIFADFIDHRTGRRTHSIREIAEITGFSKNTVIKASQVAEKIALQKPKLDRKRGTTCGTPEKASSSENVTKKYETLQKRDHERDHERDHQLGTVADRFKDVVVEANPGIRLADPKYWEKERKRWVGLIRYHLDAISATEFLAHAIYAVRQQIVDAVEPGDIYRKWDYISEVKQRKQEEQRRLAEERRAQAAFMQQRREEQQAAMAEGMGPVREVMEKYRKGLLK